MRKKELAVGLFVIIGLVLLYMGFQYLKGINFLSSVKIYYALYENVDKLSVSDPVYVNGYAVGRVSNINMMHDTNLVQVELEIDSEIELGDSTKAILSSDVLGSKSIMLIVRKVKGVLEENSTLNGEVEMGMIAKFSENAQPVAANLQTTLHKLGIVLDNLNNNSGKLQDILDKLDKTPGLVNATLKNVNQKLNEVSGEIKMTSKSIDSTVNSLGPTIANIEVITDSLKQIRMGETMGGLRTTMKALNGTLTQLQKNNNTAGRLMTEDSLYVNFNHLLLRIDTLVMNLNENPRHFFSPFGKKKKAKKRSKS